MGVQVTNGAGDGDGHIWGQRPQGLSHNDWPGADRCVCVWGGGGGGGLVWVGVAR
jgi:hypothetical protein